MWRCHKCGRPVYFAERKQSLGYDWHPECLRCEECGRRLEPGRHADHKGVPYCHVPCYGALFGPQLFGHGTRVESHKSFGRGRVAPRTTTGASALPKDHLVAKIRVYNQFHDGRSGEIRSREVNGRVIVEGALRIHWGVKGVIHLKENDDQRTVVTIRKRNSCRYSINKESSDGTFDSFLGRFVTQSTPLLTGLTSSSVDSENCGNVPDKIEKPEIVMSPCSADSGNQSSESISVTPTPPPSPAIASNKTSATLPTNLSFRELDWDELDQLLQVERKVDGTDVIYQTMPKSLPSQSSIDSSESISLSNSESTPETFNVTTQSNLDSPLDSYKSDTLFDIDSSNLDCSTLKPISTDKSCNTESFDDYDDKTLRPESDVDLRKLLDRNDIMPIDKDIMSRSLNDDTLKVNSPIDPKKINDSLKLYGDIVRSISTDGNFCPDNYSLSCENKLEQMTSDDFFNNTITITKNMKSYGKNGNRLKDQSAYNRTISMDGKWTIGSNNKENYELSRSVSGPEHLNRAHNDDSSSDEGTINYAHPVDDYIIIPNEGKVAIRKGTSKLGSTAIKRRTGRRRQRAAALKRRCSINGHFYNRETSFFTPPYGSQMSVWVTSLVSTQEVINLMLDKYKVDSNAQNFALFIVRDNGEQRRLRDDEYPLLVRVLLGPHEEITRLFLMDADKTGEVSSEVAQFLNLSLHECEAILQMYHKEEQREVDKVKEKYAEMHQRIKQRMEELKVRL